MADILNHESVFLQSIFVDAFVYLFSGEDLIAPCHCRGTQKYVHRSCLDNWRSTKVNACFFSALTGA